MSNNESPVTQRRTVALTAEKMDAVGQFDREENREENIDLEIGTGISSGDKKKTTPPVSDNGDEALPLVETEEEEESSTLVSQTNLSSSDDAENTTVENQEEGKESKDDAKNVMSVPLTSTTKMEMMEIDHDHDEDLDADMERLLGSDDDEKDEEIDASGLRQRRKRKQQQTKCCRPYKVGNSIIACPIIHQHTGFGVIGVHWFGPIFTMLLFLLASHHFVAEASDVGPITYWICILWSIFTCVTLILVSFSDPGIVMNTVKLPANASRWRWCDFCQQYQPPTGAHCPDCNVCVEGYDHHCVWMGTCIGKKNFKAFSIFNISWLLYLIYCIIWVAIVGPALT
mmetsp:Transcript_2048/g.3150  ORF Transcript_2048/g.3150 Transcript_2048/m.3150 type:complete len:342 (-) Transcript_2048:221-1246(-)